MPISSKNPLAIWSYAMWAKLVLDHWLHSHKKWPTCTFLNEYLAASASGQCGRALKHLASFSSSKASFWLENYLFRKSTMSSVSWHCIKQTDEFWHFTQRILLSFSSQYTRHMNWCYNGVTTALLPLSIHHNKESIVSCPVNSSEALWVDLLAWAAFWSAHSRF